MTKKETFMEQVSPTRMNLIQRKLQIKMAQQGVDLLKNKRDALIREFFELVKPLVRLREDLNAKLARAGWNLFLASSYEGEERVRSAGMAAKDNYSVKTTSRNLWGIRIRGIEPSPRKRTPLERGYALSGVSARIDQAAESFEELTDTILKLAPVEQKLRKFGEETKKTTRRVNALEQALIPRLIAEKRYIQQALEEREREDVFRLKHIKRKR